MSALIDLAELREIANGARCYDCEGVYAFPPADLLVLVEAVEAAQAFISDGSNPTRDSYGRMVTALAPFAAAGSRVDTPGERTS